MILFGILFAIVLVIIIGLVLGALIRRFFLLPKSDYFVSHRSTDNEVILPIVDMLKERNFRVWIDLAEIREKQLHGRFRYPISVGIQHSSVALLFTSQAYCSSDYCMQEARFFLKRFASHPNNVVEVSLDENDVRGILGLSSKSVCIPFRVCRGDRRPEPAFEVLVNEIISQTRSAL